jgi:hypothetical protein
MIKRNTDHMHKRAITNVVQRVSIRLYNKYGIIIYIKMVGIGIWNMSYAHNVTVISTK